MLHNLRLERCACAPEVIEIDIEPLVDRLMDLMVAVTELSWSNTLLQRPGLACCTVFIRSADIQRLIATGAAEAREDVSGQHLCQIPEMRDVVHIWQCRCNQSFLHMATIPMAGIFLKMLFPVIF